ncbi:MAG: phosphotransferase family protein [Pseudonocardiaceae bacterium]
MNQVAVSRLLARLVAEAGLPRVVRREPIRVWRLSGVERLRPSGGPTVVFKYALAPFTGEDRVLAEVAAHGVPVPRVHAAVVFDGMLGMILEDLGDPVRAATEHDAAVAAVRLHAVPPAAWLDRLGESDLAALPSAALACLDALCAAGRFTDAGDLFRPLTTLHHMAPARAAGTERPPFGLCHGELHPSAVLITPTGWRLLDFAMALHGPGLLDLAAWSGLRRPADPPRTRDLLERYVHIGGHRDALTDRGGLPAERWALGWHRVQAATWLLTCAATGVDDPATDPRHLLVLHRQLTSAHELLIP